MADRTSQVSTNGHRQPQIPLLEIGTTGLKRSGGFIQEEFLPDLRQHRRGYTIPDMAWSDAIIGGSLRILKLMMRRAGFVVKPAGADNASQEHAAFLHDALFQDMSTPWLETEADMHSFLEWGFCMPGDQLVLRGDGTPVPIQEIRQGEMVLTDKGRAREVHAVSCHPHDGDIIQIHVRGYPFPLRLTPEHKLPTNHGWKIAGELTIDDELLRPRLPLQPGGDYDSGWLVGVYLAEGHRRRERRRGQKGPAQRTTVILSIHRKEGPELQERLNAWVARHVRNTYALVRRLVQQGVRFARIQEQTGHDYRTIASWGAGKTRRQNVGAQLVHPRGEAQKNSARVVLSRPEFRALIDKWVTGHDAHTKALTMFPHEQQFAEGMLEGWMWGDGHRGVHQDKATATGCTVSRTLAHQLQLLAGSLGIPSPLFYREAQTSLGTVPCCSYSLGVMPTRQIIWKRTPDREEQVHALRHAGWTQQAIADSVGVHVETIRRWLGRTDEPPKVQGFQCRVYPTTIGHPIVRLERVPYHGAVYDLEVDEDHTFCAGPLIVSNSYHEVCWKRRLGDRPGLTETLDPHTGQPIQIELPRSRYTDGQWAWDKWPIRAQDTLFRWQFDPWGQVIGMEQLDPWAGHGIVTIPLAKALLFRAGPHKGNPEGMSLIRNAYSAWFRKRRILDYLGMAIEREAGGIPLAEVPPDIMMPDATAEEQALYRHIQDLVINIRQDEQAGIVWPMDYNENGQPTYRLSLLQSAGRRAQPIVQALQYLDTQMAISLLTDVVLLGHDIRGSQALATNKTELLLNGVKALNAIPADVMTRQAVVPLARLNGWPVETVPTVEVGELQSESAMDLGRFLAEAAKAGLAFEDIENAVRGRVGLPPRLTEDDELDGDADLVKRDADMGRGERRDLADACRELAASTVVLLAELKAMHATPATPPPMRKRVVRDTQGLIVTIVDEPVTA